MAAVTRIENACSFDPVGTSDTSDVKFSDVPLKERMKAPGPLGFGSSLLERPIHLAYLVSEYPAVSHTFILREVRRLRGMNFDVRVASINRCAQPPSAMSTEEHEEAAGTFYIKSAGARGAVQANLATLFRRPGAYLRGLIFAIGLAGADLNRIVFAFFYFVEAVMLGRWMEMQGLGHVHVHFANPAAQVALIASRVFPIRFSLTVHGPDEFYDTRGQRLKEKIEGASFVCCISHFAISQLMMLSAPSEWHKFELVRSGVDPEVFTPQPRRPAPDPFEILCVGRLVAVKGQQILLEAVDRIVRKGARIRLRLVSDGPQRARLEQEAIRRGLKSHVVFEGIVHQDRILECFRAADAFVLASFAEGVPAVLMEAMAMGIPCVSTYVGGIPQLIRDDVDGLLVAPADVQALVSAIERLIADPALRARLGAAGRIRVLECYNLGPNVVRLAKIFSGRLARHSPSQQRQLAA
jgi:colanic acid/amylovoran biosynthesis glycosyltransferase